MFASAILDVAIGLVFVYLLLSLMCSALTELLEAFLKKRASNLERGLRELLADPTGTALVKDVYDHPLIAGLFRGTYTPGKTNNLPSYLPSRAFALTLLDIALPKAGAPTAIGVSGGRGTGAAVALAPTPSLRDTIANIQNEHLQRILLPLIDSAGNDYARTLEAIANWYNIAMERVGGWYKRRTQAIILLVGMALGIALNADTITIIRVLSRDPTARATLVAAAADYSKAQPIPPDSTAPDAAKLRFENSITNVERLGLPLGWDRMNIELVPQGSNAWMLRILGWVLTAVAVSLGAPFWFDLLNKFISVRASAKPKASTA